MGNLYNKANAPYLIAGTLATLTLLASGFFTIAPYVAFLSPIAAFDVVLPVALSVSIFSILVLALSYKIIKNNKEIEIEKNKFAKQNTELGNTKQQLEAILKESNNRDSQIRELKDKIRELNNKIIEVVDAASKQTEKLNDQLHKLTRKRLDADKEVENWKSILSEEKESFEQKLEGRTNRIDELCRMVNELEKIINTPYKQEKKLHYKRQIKELHYKRQIKELHYKRQIKELHYKRIKGLLHCKISRLREQLQEEGKLAEKKEYIATLGRIISNDKYEEPKNKKLDKEKEELHAELNKQRFEIKELTKENKDLSKKLRDAKNSLESQFIELERINKGYDNEVKELKNSLLSESFERRQCEEDLLKKKKEEVVFIQQMIEYVVGKVEQSVKGSKEIIDDDKKIILQMIQEIKSVLEKEAAQYLQEKASHVEDLGYNSRCSTPVGRY